MRNHAAAPRDQHLAPVREQLAAVQAIAVRRADRETLAICDDMAQILGVIASGAERTTTIVKDLRTFSRLDEGHTAVVQLADGLRVTLNQYSSQHMPSTWASSADFFHFS